MCWFRENLFNRLLLITGGGTALLLSSALVGLVMLHNDLLRLAVEVHRESVAARADRELLEGLGLMGGATVLAFALFWILARRWIMAPAQALIADLERLASGDFSIGVRLGRAAPGTATDAFGAVARAVERLRTGLGALIGGLTANATELGKAVFELRATAQRTLDEISGQRLQTEQVATAMNEMAASVQEVARNTQTTAESARQGKELATSGAMVASEAKGAIETLAYKLRVGGEVMVRLQAAAGEIGGVLAIIAGLADQTNLLALNAAIEAARAGEHGRGFAVVADEVRSLSQQTRASTERIREAVDRIQGGALDAVAAMQEADTAAGAGEGQVERSAEALAEISGAVATISDLAAQIASAAEEQSAVAAEIDRNVVAIAEGGRGSEHAAGELREWGERLQALVAELAKHAGRFRLAEGEELPSRGGLT